MVNIVMYKINQKKHTTC